MTRTIGEELLANARILRARAIEAEEAWRADRGLNKPKRKRRKRAACPKEPKANVRYRKYQTRRLGKLGAASSCRRMDPATGLVIEGETS